MKKKAIKITTETEAKKEGQTVSRYTTTKNKKNTTERLILKKYNRQDYVFIRPPGISEGAFQLRMDNIWFCKLLLLFKLYTRTDAGMQYLDCAYVSVLEEYRGPRKSGHIVHILHIFYFLIVDRPQPGWISVNLQSSMSAVNKHKSCM